MSELLTAEELNTYKLHPMLDSIVNILCERIQNPDKSFFAIQTCYALSKVATAMRCVVDGQGHGKHQVNFYAFNFAPSGYGKGHANRILEEQVVDRFTNVFKEQTFESVAEDRLVNLANKRAIKYGEDPAEMLDKVKAEYTKLGKYMEDFDSGSPEGVKQYRHKLLMGEVGSINYVVDEIGENLDKNAEIFKLLLELYDGMVKGKLIKNSTDNTRNEEIKGRTPTNMICFGTPNNVLDGSTNEKIFFKLQDTGFGRRCFTGYSCKARITKSMTIQERLDRLCDNSTDVALNQISVRLEKLADPINMDFKVKIPKSVLYEIERYRAYCEDISDSLKSSDSIRKAELDGRYFKTIRLAGVFAFLDSCGEMEISHWQSAVKIAEMSAKGFNDLLSRPPAHARLAMYLSECSEPTTTAELMEELPYFPKSTNLQKDILKHSTAWGYKNNVIIKRSHIDDIEFFQGESLKETDLNSMILSYSNHEAYDYLVPKKPFKFSGLSQLTTLAGYNWTTHHFIGEHRCDANTIQGFNLLVLDIDGTTTISHVQAVLQDFTYHIHTTKSHTDQDNHFRVVLPMSHILKFSKEEFKQFMTNVYEYLPFGVDEVTAQPSRKWSCCGGAQVFNNTGKLFDVLPFISKTKKNEERKKAIEATGSMDKLERFFFNNAEDGNRSNMLIRYGFSLVDAGYDLDTCNLKIGAFNGKIPNPITSDELQKTVLYSTMKKWTSKNTH